MVSTMTQITHASLVSDCNILDAGLENCVVMDQPTNTITYNIMSGLVQERCTHHAGPCLTKGVLVQPKHDLTDLHYQGMIELQGIIKHDHRRLNPQAHGRP
jgi:hypothetical protein